MDIWPTPAPGRYGCCPCCRRAGTGRARSWPGSCRSRRARRAGISTACASSATPSRRNAAGQPAGGHVVPRRLGLLGRRWSLVGYALDRQGWRSCRLDRLTGPEGRGARFRPRELPAADAAAFVRGGVQSTRTGYDIEVIVEAPAEMVRERIGRWASGAEIRVSRCRVRVTADALEWPVMGLGMGGGE